MKNNNLHTNSKVYKNYYQNVLFDKKIEKKNNKKKTANRVSLSKNI